MLALHTGGAYARGCVSRHAVGQELPGLVDHGDAFRPQAVDGRSHQMTNGAHLLRLKAATHLEHDGGRRFHLFAREQRPLRQHEMDARRLHAVDGADGAGELAFERAEMVDVLNEARRAQDIGFIENLVADAAAFRQAGFGELHAQPRNGILRDEDGAAVHLQFEGNALPLQVSHDGAGIGLREIAEQRRHLRRGDAQDDEGEESDERGRDGSHRRQSRRTQRSQKIEEPLQRTAPGRTPRGVSPPGNNCPVYGFGLVNWRWRPPRGRASRHAWAALVTC